MPKAAVLPVPVLAWPMTSRPSSALGMKAAWMGVGCKYRASLRARSVAGLRSMDRNPVAGSVSTRRINQPSENIV